MIEVDWWVTFLDFIKEHKLPPGIDQKSIEATRILSVIPGLEKVTGCVPYVHQDQVPNIQ
jgi:hypothetical protein